MNIDQAIGIIAEKATAPELTAEDVLILSQAMEQMARTANILASTEIVKGYKQNDVDNPLAGFDIPGAAN